MATYRRPGVYVEEISTLPPSVIPIETAIPIFMGYTNIGTDDSLHLKPQKIFSMREYENIFGRPHPETTSISVRVNLTEEGDALPENIIVSLTEASRSPHIMYYALRAYFLNGGGPCWIISVGPYSGIVSLSRDSDSTGLLLGLNEAEFVAEATILVFPEAMHLSNGDRKTLYDSALLQCEKKKNRFLIADATTQTGSDIEAVATTFRDSMIGFNHLKYGAAYAPNLSTVLDFEKTDASITVSIIRLSDSVEVNLEEIRNGLDYSFRVDGNLRQITFGRSLYNLINAKIADLPMTLPPSPIMAGIYVQVDQTRGVFKAPANLSLNGVVASSIKISDEEHDMLNIDSSGKSINAIRSFAGRGILVFGARTLAGNDNEWKYISVRRFFNFAEVSISNTIQQFLFEPNDKNTWERIRAMISNFLTIQWQQGALTGDNPQQAFFVNVGLGSTMTAVDILEGRLNVEIGMAVVRPAEFIILKFSHLMQVS